MVESFAAGVDAAPSDNVIDTATQSLPPIPGLTDWSGPKTTGEAEFEQKMIKVICGMPESC